MHQAQDVTPLTTMTGTGDLATILDVMRTMMVDRESRERELTEEMRRQAAKRRGQERQEITRGVERHNYEEESERRISIMHKQMEMLQELVRRHTKKETKRDTDTMKLTQVTDVKILMLRYRVLPYHFQANDDSVRSGQGMLGFQISPAAYWQSTTGLCCTRPERCQVLQHGKGDNSTALQHQR